MSMPLVDTVGGFCLLTITDYFTAKERPPHEYIDSRKFAVGGHDWIIRCYLNWRDSNGGDDADADDVYVSLFLVRVPVDSASGSDVMATYNMKVRGHSASQCAVEMHETRATHGFAPGGLHGGPFVKRSKLEESGFIHDNRVIIICTVQVHVRLPPPGGVIVPPSDLHEHLRHLLESGKEADVTFNVGGEIFRAHRCILATRAPVFEAEVFGLKEEGEPVECLAIDDMHASVFRAMLLFVYTDVLPEAVELTGDDSKESSTLMAQRLLVAADRYRLENMTLCCVERLCRDVGVATVVATMVLARRHQLQQLEAYCCRYIVEKEGRFRAVMQTDAYQRLTVRHPWIRDVVLLELRKIPSKELLK